MLQARLVLPALHEANVQCESEVGRMQCTKVHVMQFALSGPLPEFAISLLGCTHADSMIHVVALWQCAAVQASQ